MSRHNRRLRANGPAVPPSGSPLQRMLLPLMRVAFVGVALLGVGLLSASLWREFVAIDALTLSTVRLHGARRVNKEALLAAAKINYGDPLLTLELQAAASAMMTHPWVRKATLRRQLPNRLHIDVQEHEPRALMMMGQLWVINTMGEPFKPFDSDDSHSMPVISGIVRERASELFATSPALEEEQQATLCRALQLCDEVQKDLGQHWQISQVHVDDDLGYSVYLLPSQMPQSGAPAARNEGRPLTIHLGLTPLTRIGQVQKALVKLHDSNVVAHTLWASGERAPNRLQVRPYASVSQMRAKGAEK